MRLREDAEEMLKAIEDSSVKTNDAYDKLKAGYLRLWKLGALKGYDELRICLFRLILCSFEPLSVDHVTCILQNRNGSLSVRDTENLYSNFLVSDLVKQDLRFTHNSAREFVVREILGTISGGPRESLASLVMKESHRSIAKLFVDFIQRSNNRDSQHVFKAFDLFYFSNLGLQHCKYAAEKQSIFDKVWSDMIQRVLLSPGLRSPDVILALDIVPKFRDSLNIDASRHFIYRESEGEFHFLFSHFIVWLDIIHGDDASDPRLENLKTASSDTGTPEGMLRHFAEQAAVESTIANANALHIACFRGNAAAVNLVLKSTYYLYGKDACTDLLSQQIVFPPYTRGTPFVLAVINNRESPRLNRLDVSTVLRFDVMEALLLFESRYLATTDDKDKANSSQASHRVQQWSHVCRSHSALTYAMVHFQEETVCRLLKIAGPIAVNEPDKSGYTPLMTAAHMGRLEIMRILLEDYHADLNVRGQRGTSAWEVAQINGQEAASDYLKERMSISEPEQSVNLSSEINKNTS